MKKNESESTRNWLCILLWHPQKKRRPVGSVNTEWFSFCSHVAVTKLYINYKEERSTPWDPLCFGRYNILFVFSRTILVNSHWICWIDYVLIRSMCNVILNSGERLWKPQSGDARDTAAASVPFVIYVSKNRCALIGGHRWLVENGVMAMVLLVCGTTTRWFLDAIVWVSLYVGVCSV